MEKPVTQLAAQTKAKTKIAASPLALLAVDTPLALRLEEGQCTVCSSELPLDIHGLGDRRRELKRRRGEEEEKRRRGEARRRGEEAKR